MQKVGIDDVEDRMGPASVARQVSDALEATNMAMRYYELAPTESFAFGYHAHENQEEVFYIQSGAVTFETEDGDVDVEAGELVRFAPGEYQQGVNTGSERVIAFALGAPQDTGNTTMLRHCEGCGGRTTNYLKMADSGDELLARCSDCDAETGRFD